MHRITLNDSIAQNPCALLSVHSVYSVCNKCSNIPKTLENTIVNQLSINCLGYPLLPPSCWKWLNPKTTFCILIDVNSSINLRNIALNRLKNSPKFVFFSIFLLFFAYCFLNLHFDKTVFLYA